MKRDELLKLCRYYKGEDVSPFPPGSMNSRFWILERDYVNVGNEGENYTDMVLQTWSSLRTFLVKFDKKRQAMLANFVVMSYSHDPMGGVDFILEYGK